MQWRIRVTESTKNYIENYVIDEKIPKNSIGMALDFIIEDYSKLKSQSEITNFTQDIFLKNMQQTIKDTLKNEVATELKRVRLGTNNTDRNTQILIELLQGYIASTNTPISTTEIYKPEFLIEIEQLIFKRITEMKEKKHSK